MANLVECILAFIFVSSSFFNVNSFWLRVIFLYLPCWCSSNASCFQFRVKFCISKCMEWVFAVVTLNILFGATLVIFRTYSWPCAQESFLAWLRIWYARDKAQVSNIQSITFLLYHFSIPNSIYLPSV